MWASGECTVWCSCGRFVSATAGDFGRMMSGEQGCDAFSQGVRNEANE